MDTYKFVVPIEVRFRDLDSLGHINNSVYFTYCEIARTAYWRKLFSTRRLAEAGFILAHAEIDYRAQANDERRLLIGIRASAFGRTSFEFRYRFEQEETGLLIAEGRSVQVCFDYKKNGKIAIPESVKQQIIAFEGKENFGGTVG